MTLNKNEVGRLLQQHALFDAEWYIAHYSDAATSNLSPLEHFLNYGWPLGRRPGPGFDPDYYLQANEDVAANQLDPLLHFLQYGQDEGRPGVGSLPQVIEHPHYRLLAGSGLFDALWYLAYYSDVAQSGADPLVHYLYHGAREGRHPGPAFDPAFYLSQLGQPLPGGVSPLAHYLAKGKAAGLLAAPPLHNPPWWLEHTPRRLEWETAPLLNELAALCEPPAVLVPVFDHTAPAALAACLQHLRLHTRPPCRVLLLVNGPISQTYEPVLSAYRGLAPFEHYSTPHQLTEDELFWFGVTLAGEQSDVVWLPPAFLPMPGWLGRLQQAAYAHAGTGMVSPLGSSDFLQEIFATPPGAEQQARALAQTSPRRYPRGNDVPGACIYIRQACLHSLPANIPLSSLPGTAASHGWHYRQDDASWLPSESKPDLPAANTVPVLPRVLYVLSVKDGGTPQTNQDLMQALAGHIEPLVLYCRGRVIILKYYQNGVYHLLERHELAAPVPPLPHTSSEYDGIVAGMLLRYSIELVHIRHIAWHGLGLIATARQLSVPVVFSFHDYYAVCPSLKLLDERLQFCAGRCTASLGRCHPELWPAESMPPLKHGAVLPWQNAFARGLARCNAFVTTSAQTRSILCKVYPFLSGQNFSVIPHGRDFPVMADLAQKPTPGSPLRVLLPGTLSNAKGAQILFELANQQHVELHILGKPEYDLELPPSVICHGRYERAEFAQKVEAIRPHVGAVLSIWPETHCHTLTELWACGVPVVGFDTGAVGERLQESGAGWAVSPLTAHAVLHTLEQVAQPAEWEAKHQAALHWQRHLGQQQSCAFMAESYQRLYNSLLNGQDNLGQAVAKKLLLLDERVP